jgi:hypothetical protein
MAMAYHTKSKVTACHAMSGNRSSGDDIRKGDTILPVEMDNNEDCMQNAVHGEYCLSLLLS